MLENICDAGSTAVKQGAQVLFEMLSLAAIDNSWASTSPNYTNLDVKKNTTSHRLLRNM